MENLLFKVNLEFMNTYKAHIFTITDNTHKLFQVLKQIS